MASWYQEMKAHLLVRGQLSTYSLEWILGSAPPRELGGW